MDIRQAFRDTSAFFKKKKGKKVLKWTNRLINVGVIVWLVYQLSTIGWGKVWRSLPTEPFFYVLFLLLFVQLPFFEIIIYRITWTFNALKSVPIFLLKRFYNKDVMGYSGELYFFTWANKTLSTSGKNIFKIIKDNNIISSVASTFVSLGLLSVFLFTDQLKIIKYIASQNLTYFIGGLLLVIIIVILFVKFRHYVISMPLSTAYEIFGIQIFRLLLGQLMNLLMFYVVLPEVSLYIWFTFIAIDIILSRIPFLPNRDLIFASMSIVLAGRLAVPQEAIAGITLTKGVLNKVGGAVSFGLAHIFKKMENMPKTEENMEQYAQLNSQEENSNKSES